MVEKNLSWFRKLLEHTLPAESGQTGESLKISCAVFPINCIRFIL